MTRLKAGSLQQCRFHTYPRLCGKRPSNESQLGMLALTEWFLNSLPLFTGTGWTYHTTILQLLQQQSQ